jgi:hypothetical protein
MSVDWGNRKNCPSASLRNPITNKEKGTIYLYPNPARNNISVVGENVEEWKIINQLGEVILKGTEQNINIEPIKKGLYYLLSTNQGITSSTKFIKK